MSSWIITASGARFELLAPNPAAVRLADVAHALSNVCRFGGHVRLFYSVAQHSVLVSRRLERLDEGLEAPSVQRAGLLHDAAEAYVGDVTRPMKQLLALTFEGIEARVLRSVFAGLGIEFPDAWVWSLVKRADVEALLTERRDLLPPSPASWEEDASGVQPWSEEIVPMEPAAAEAAFLARALELGIGS